jgi:hypothetical protein
LNFISSPAFNLLNEGDYSILVRDANDCESESYPVTLTIADTVSIDTIVATDAACLGLDNGTLEITAAGGSGNYEYSADGGDNFVTTSSITSLPAGDYAVIVRDDNDCSSEEKPVTLVYADTVDIVSVEKTDLTCSGLPDGTITINASGGTVPMDIPPTVVTAGTGSAISSLARATIVLVGMTMVPRKLVAWFGRSLCFGHL